MEIYCAYGHCVHRAGGLVNVLLRSPNNFGSYYREAVVLAQAHGHVHWDPRWIKTTGNLTNILLQTTKFQMDQKIQIPRHCSSSNSLSLCTFLTPREVIHLSHLCSDGVYLQFELPNDTLPSFKGLSVSISYLITISIQLPNGTKYVHFPFRVSGRGDASAPQYIRFSPLSIYPASALPPEAPLLPPLEDEEDEEVEGGFSEEFLYSNSIHHEANPSQIVTTHHAKDSGSIYAIRDDDNNLLCVVKLKSNSLDVCYAPDNNENKLLLRPGDSIFICLDFQNTMNDKLQLPLVVQDRSQCHAVRARFLQNEIRPDGSRLQEKVIDSISRTTSDATAILLRLLIPDQSTCSFACPLLQVTYHLALDFYLYNGNKSNSNSIGKDPLAWNLTLDVSPVGIVTKSPRVEAMSCLEPPVSWISTAVLAQQSS